MDTKDFICINCANLSSGLPQPIPCPNCNGKMRQFTIGDRKQIASKKQLEDIELQELKKKFENENSNNWFDSADNRTKSRSCTDDFSYLLQQFIFKKLEEKYASDWIKNSKSILGDRVGLPPKN